MLNKSKEKTPLYLLLKNKCVEANQNGKATFSFDELSYEFDVDIPKLKATFYRVRIGLEDEKTMSFIKQWGQTENGNRCLIGFKIANQTIEDIAEVIADLHDDKRAVFAKANRLENRARAAKTTLHLPGPKINKFILISDSKKP